MDLALFVFISLPEKDGLGQGSAAVQVAPQFHGVDDVQLVKGLEVRGICGVRTRGDTDPFHGQSGRI
ncbi:hypothetical protein StoSoilB3_29910 [Arthrobacter sp. StoSoilB3]|nr:hypothetical protein StoSoilB3_29910 [Arthrobacter sp. StoSoilB3]